MTWTDAQPWVAFGLMSYSTSIVVTQSVFSVKSLISVNPLLIAGRATTFARDTLEGAR